MNRNQGSRSLYNHLQYIKIMIVASVSLLSTTSTTVDPEVRKEKLRFDPEMV